MLCSESRPLRPGIAILQIDPEDRPLSQHRRQVSQAERFVPAVISIAAAPGDADARPPSRQCRSEEHTSELQSLMRISYAVFCLKKKTNENKSHSKPVQL